MGRPIWDQYMGRPPLNKKICSNVSLYSVTKILQLTAKQTIVVIIVSKLNL